MLLLTETWLKDSDHTALRDLCPEGYQFLANQGVQQHMSGSTHKREHMLHPVITKDTDTHLILDRVANDTMSDHFSIYFSITVLVQKAPQSWFKYGH